MRLFLRCALAVFALAAPGFLAAQPGEPLWTVDTGG